MFAGVFYRRMVGFIRTDVIEGLICVIVCADSFEAFEYWSKAVCALNGVSSM